MTSVTPPRDRPRWWIAAITFVTGVVVGIVMVGLLSLSKPDFLSAVESTAPGSAQMPSGAGTVPDRGPGAVTAACLNVINKAQDIYSIVDTTISETQTATRPHRYRRWQHQPAEHAQERPHPDLPVFPDGRALTMAMLWPWAIRMRPSPGSAGAEEICGFRRNVGDEIGSAVPLATVTRAA